LGDYKRWGGGQRRHARNRLRVKATTLKAKAKVKDLASKAKAKVLASLFTTD